MRGKVLDIFPVPPGLPRDRDAYLRSVDDIYRSDAYHSLSIEGYSVSPELIEQVGAGNWDPDHLDADRQSRDALAARGPDAASLAEERDAALREVPRSGRERAAPLPPGWSRHTTG